MNQEIKKDKNQKLEKKIQNRQISLYEILQQDIIIQWFRMGNPAVTSMFNAKTMTQMIEYIIKVGPPDNQIRSYKIPMIATEILSLPMPKVFDLFYLQDQNSPGGIILGRLIQYFSMVPNYVISAYVIRIINTLMVGNASKILEFIMKSESFNTNVIRFLESHSIAQFLLRIIIVQDILLNNHIKERIQLFDLVIQTYSDNTVSSEILYNCNFILCESIVRLWTQKHKELGRFSTSLFRIVEIIIDKNNLYQQHNLITVVIKHLTCYNKEASYLIIALYKKIYKQFLLLKQSETIKNSAKIIVPKFTMKNIKLLQALYFIFHDSAEIISKHLATSNIFSFLLDYISKYEWNSLALVEIQKILKVSFRSGSQAIFNALNHAFLAGKIKELLRNQLEKGKFGRGYTGILMKILRIIYQQLKCSSLFALYFINTSPEVFNLEFIQRTLSNAGQLISPNSMDSNYRVVHDVAKPYYHLNRLNDTFKSFFDETETINRKYEMDNPKDSSKLHKEDDVLEEIQNENQLVYKLLTQVTQNTEQKKIQTQVNQ